MSLETRSAGRRDRGAGAVPDGAMEGIGGPAPPAGSAPRRLARDVLPLLAVALAALGGLGVAGWPPPRVCSLGAGVPAAGTEAGPVGEAQAGEEGRTERAERLAALAPRGVWIEVDTWNNRLRVWKGEELLRDAVCSTGTGMVLRDPRDGRTWVFDTPLGERRVRRKVADPVWVKPDWAFIEEGMEPPASYRERVDDVALGEYGLYLGDGYIIHGTLFQSLLGRPATHGCIRLGDEDLEFVYRRVPLGAQVLLH